MDEFLLELDLADAAEKEEASAASSLEQYTKELYTMSVFLEDAGLAKLQQVLHGETLNMYNAQLACGRPEFLLSLNKKGVMALADRQKLANAIAKARRDGRLPTLSTAQLMRQLALPDGDGKVLIPMSVPAQGGRVAKDKSAVPRVIYQTYRTRRISARAWENVCSIFDLNPEWSYEFYDDARCEQMIKAECGERTSEAFAKLRAGAAKADLWRRAF